jgi:hypothetical protein
MGRNTTQLRLENNKQTSLSMDFEVFQSKILQYMPCEPIFFKDDIPCIKWHHFAQSPYIKECRTSLKGKKVIFKETYSCF